MSAQHILDAVQSLPRIKQLDSTAYLEALRGELGETLEQQDDALRAALAAIDALAARVMKIRLDHDNDASIAPPTRKVFAATIVNYAGQVDTLIARAYDIAARDTPNSAAVAARVGASADAALAIREALRLGVLALAKQLATEHVPIADRSARDRTLDEPTRRRWSSARRELEAIAAHPERIATAPFAARATPAELDEPTPEATFAEMIELD